MSKSHDAMKTLIAGGKGEQARDLVRRRAAAANRAYVDIRADTTLSDTGKRHQLALAAKQCSLTLQVDLEQMAGTVVVTDRDDATNVLGTGGLKGDPASLTISMRDAADRVEQVTERSELKALLTRATRSGDEVLARAIAAKALDNLDAEVMTQFIDDRPALDASAQRLWDAKQATSDTFGLTLELSEMRPSEFYGMDDQAVQDIADGEGATPVPAGAGWSGWGGDAA